MNYDYYLNSYELCLFFTSSP